MTERGTRKELVGKVLSDRMQKTIIVEAQRRVAHTTYQKVVMRKKKFYAHDEQEKAGPGDVVRIRETRPLSKMKRWTLVEVVRAAKSAEAAGGPKIQRRSVPKEEETTEGGTP